MIKFLCFNVIEVWRIRQQVFKRIPGIGKGGFDTLPFVERRVVHDNYASGQELGQKVLCNPRMEDVGIDQC
ncbi:hypothetical protein NX761_11630 [Nitrosomonas sp. PLL12]|uniref:Uncharacterized protein n=1 Tax=Nitrosomonas communis TaxID=44574 RepID=A0A0F7KH80_9PROT|nr:MULTISPECIES: hypothetical protein [Nitrosomonas]AKH38202.1 hypothetical protein AAW31_11005 [Nitrosomonas communis]UVS60168.1 hypothetical protein NX761_11630 [Nitrosomonas sp. PLL12]